MLGAHENNNLLIERMRNMNLCDPCLKTTKGSYIPKQRRELEKNFGKQAVTEVFGKPTELEETEILLLETEESQIALLHKYDNLIKATHKISVICLDFFICNNVSTRCQEYILLKKGIPIPEIQSEFFGEFFLQIHYLALEDKISVEQLKAMKAQLEKGEENQAELVALDFLANLVLVSLRRILEEVKEELDQ